jgi:hypothetical protein
MQGLDDIQWQTLHHAYGTADDVPDLLRRLQSADPSSRNEDSSLWQLFGNIWHQGTIYEATCYAVPFLISLVADPATRDRVGILRLLAAIAQGTSYLAVHEEFLRKTPVEKLGIPGIKEFERELAEERAWVASAHSAVAEGYDIYAELVVNLSDTAYAGANVLASLKVRSADTSRLLVQMLERESRSLYRAGVLLLIGEHDYDSSEVRRVVHMSASAETVVERRAAAIAATRLHHAFSAELHDAVIDAICDEDLDGRFEGLPWDASDRIDRDELLDAEPDAAEDAVEQLLSSAESGTAHQESYYTLFQLLFGRDGTIDPGRLNIRQQRTLNALVQAIDVQGMEFHTSFSCFGLPDSRRELRSMAAGRPATPKVNEMLPVIGAADNPARPIAVWRLKPGDRLHSRYFGRGKVIEVRPRKYDVEVVIEFDEEGRTTLGLVDSRPKYLIDTARYFLLRLTGRNRRRDLAS